MPRTRHIVPAAQARRTAEASAGGRAWLARLPGIISHLEQAWSVTVGEALPGGKHAFVARARTTDGSPVVLKVAPPGTGFAGQIRVLAAARGRGYVRLLDADPEREAALLEPLGTSLADAAASSEQALDVMAATLRQAWQVPLPPGAQPAAGTGGDSPETNSKAGELIALIQELWTMLGRPCSARLVARALECAGRRQDADHPRSRILCHGDPHPANALAVLAPRPGAESGFVFIDPEGLPTEAAYDLGVLVRGWPEQVLCAADPAGLIRGYCGRLAAATGVDQQAIWEWGFAERVSSGLYLLLHGHADEGRAFLDSGERLTASAEQAARQRAERQQAG